MQTVPAGTLRLGGSATACLHLIPSILREFRESFPEHTIQITQVNTMDAALMLQERRIDLAVIPEPADHHGGQFIVAAEDRLAFLLNPLHPWAIRNKVDRATIPREHFILPSRRIETHARIEAYFRAERIKIRPFIEIDSEGAILKLVQLDLGIGILPNWLARDELERGILKSLPLGRRKLTRRWGILARKRRLDFAENLFVGICKHVVSRMLK
jgi:DNA-binding transcriptional LysR family regulator